MKTTVDIQDLAITEDEILDLFDVLTGRYANWPDCKTTVHYYDGWQTNKAHKIGPKVILPENAYHYSTWDKTYEFSVHYDVLSDIEKVLDYLAASPHDDDWGMFSRLSAAKESGQTRNVRFKYFSVDFFKKTMHIKFNEEAMPIVARLNIFGSQRRGWLPPNYGKKSYADMTAEEKAIVDSFHGDGTEGSGAGTYQVVMQEAAYYLATPVRKLPALMAPETTQKVE